MYKALYFILNTSPMPEIDKKQRIKNRMLNYFVNYFFFILFIVFIVFFLFSFLFVLWPKYKNVSLSATQERVNINSEIEAKKSELNALKSKKEAMDSIDKDNLLKLNNMLPSKENVSYVIKELYKIADNNGFFLMDVKYFKNDNKQVSIVKENNTNGNLPPRINFFTFNITITGGGYENLKSFLKMLANSVNIRDVISVRFDGKNSYDIELKAYYYE